jgi:transcriptional regulator with XRE-family HTH domain
MENVKVKNMIDLEHVKIFHISESTRERIKELIKLKKTSQRQLAKDSDGKISYPFLSRLLCGVDEGISKEKFITLCELLNVGIEDVLSGSAKYFN